MYKKNMEQQKKCWMNFMFENKLDELNCVSSEIIESWKRSKNYNVNPNIVVAPITDSKILEQKLIKNARLINVATPYMEEIYKLVEGSGFRVILTDSEVCVLTYIGNKEIPMSNLNEPVPGTLYDEKNVGTNAINLAIELDKAMQVNGAEHYNEKFHILSESASPIHNDKGEIIACLQLASYIENSNPHTLGLVAAAVNSIERQMKIEQIFYEKSIISSQQYVTLELISDGIVIVDENEKIVNANTKATKMISAGNVNIIGKKITDILNCREFFKNIITSHSIYDEECRFNINDEILNCSVSAGRIKDKEGKVKGLVITLKEMKYVHKLVNKVSGAKAYYTFSDIIGESEIMKKNIDIAKKAALTNSNILITGESGTGKELMAQAIHNYSNRKNKPFIAINCGAIPRELVTSELFGYEGGTFTGANREGRTGKFELANGGTIFLDEIGEMPLEAQVTLLRVLQNKEIIRIGGKIPQKIDVRVIAATNRNLQEMVIQRIFRQDLYYRLNVLNINMPSLRERKGDVKLLIDYFVYKIGSSMGKYFNGITERVYEELNRYQWPGNIRELENIIERVVILNDSEYIDMKYIPENIIKMDIQNETKNDDLTLKDKEKQVIEEYLQLYSGNIRKVAEKLNVARSTVYHKVSKYNIDIKKYR